MNQIRGKESQSEEKTDTDARPRQVDIIHPAWFSPVDARYNGAELGSWEGYLDISSFWGREMWNNFTYTRLPTIIHYSANQSSKVLL
jgi:hypothetical protein